jgi:hypothetical protein
MDSCANATLVGVDGKTGVQWIAVLCALGALLAYATRPGFQPIPARAATPSGGLTFAESFPAADRKWVQAAIVQARPEARQLIGRIASRTRVVAFYEPDGFWIGWAIPRPDGGFTVRLNLAQLDGERRIDRTSVTLHELGHVVDFALVPNALRDALAAQVPRTGACPNRIRGDCASAQERFADTFAKWALRGNVSITGAGYSLPAPASLEDWGAPLARLAIDLQVAAAR